MGSGLRTIPDYFGNFKSLTSLDLTNMQNLRSLPESFRNLKILNIEKCPNLSKLSDDFDNLQSLRLVRNKSLKSLPESIGNFTNLECLHLDNNFSLRSLPESFGNLRNLSYLHIHNNSLITLPESFVNLNHNNLDYFYLDETFNNLPLHLQQFIERIRHRNDVEDYQVYNDNQNVHNSHVHGSIVTSLKNLLTEPRCTDFMKLI